MPHSSFSWKAAVRQAVLAGQAPQMVRASVMRGRLVSLAKKISLRLPMPLQAALVCQSRVWVIVSGMDPP